VMCGFCCPFNLPSVTPPFFHSNIKTSQILPCNAWALVKSGSADVASELGLGLALGLGLGMADGVRISNRVKGRVKLVNYSLLTALSITTSAYLHVH